MRAFDQLIAANQADALAQMAQESTVARRLAGKLKDVGAEGWQRVARWGLAGVLATGTIITGPAFADEYQPVYQTAQVPTATSSNSYEPVYQSAPQAQQASGGLGTALKTIAGAGIGGVLGHFIGGGRGQALATAGGALAGGVVANRMSSNERPVYAPASTYSPQNPNPYPQQTPAPAGGSASGANLGTVVGGALGALAGNQFGRGRGNIVATLGGAALGAVMGTHVENSAINSRTPNYQRALVTQDEAGACFGQWSGRLQPTRSLSENPQADGAMHQSVSKLGEAYNEYLQEASRYRQDRENARWAVSATDAQNQNRLLSQETQQMVNAEKKYVYYRGTFMEKCNLAAEEGYNVQEYNQVKQLLTLDTGGYTYRNPNPTVTATYGNPRRPGF